MVPVDRSQVARPALRRRPVVAAGGGVAPAAPQAPLPGTSATVNPLAQIVTALLASLRGLITWLLGVLRPQAHSPGVAPPVPPTTNPPVGSVTPPPAQGTPVPEAGPAADGIRLGAGRTQIDGQPAVGAGVLAHTGSTTAVGAIAIGSGSTGPAAVASGQVVSPNLVADGSVRLDPSGVSGQARLAAVAGETRVLGTVAANPQGAAGALVVQNANVQGALAASFQDGRTTLAATAVAPVGTDGALQAAALYQSGPEGGRTQVQAAYQDPVTTAGLRYTQQGDRHAAGAFVDTLLSHSNAGLGADYLWSSQGDGGRVYGRWQSDAIGEQVAGFQVRGSVEAGALKLPGQDWNTYAAGRISAERANGAIFVEGTHMAGPGVTRPDTLVMVGAQFRF